MSITVTTDLNRERVAHLELDLGELNLLSHDAIIDLRETVSSIPADVSVVTIGPGTDEEIGGLAAGLKLDDVREYSASEARVLIQDLHDAIASIRDLDAVTICLCGEYALGGGLELAMACDFRIVAEDGALGLPEVDAGLVTGIHGGLLIRLVGLQAAKEIVYTGEPVSGTEAAELGLVNQAVSPEEYDETVAELIDTLTAKSPIILQWQSQVFQAFRSNGIEAGIDHSLETIAACFDTHDQYEAMTAFLEKREPEFRGR